MRKKEQLKNQIKKLRAEGFSDYDMYSEEFINYLSHYQYRHAFFFKTIKVIEFAISNEKSCKENFLRYPCTNDPRKIPFSQDYIDHFFNRVSILFKSPETIDKILLKYVNDPKFEYYFAMVFIPTIFIGFSDEVYQDYAKTFLFQYYNYKHEFNSILNQMTASFILSNFIFRDSLRETFIFEWSNQIEHEKIENVIIDSFFKSISKLTSQQNEILEFYFKSDEKSSIILIINFILLPIINLWEFSPYFSSNTILFSYDIPKTVEGNLQIENKKCVLIERLKEIVLDSNQDAENSTSKINFKQYFSEYLNGYKPSQKIYEINSILNNEPIYLPISKLDEIISHEIEKIGNSDSNEAIENIDYQDAFIIYNDCEFKYDSKYFPFPTNEQPTFSVEKNNFQFHLQNDESFLEWKKIQARAVAMEENPIKLYKLYVNKDPEKVIEGLNFCKEELQHSIDCRFKTVEMMKTVDLFMEDLKKMKSILREIMLKFLFEFTKIIHKNSCDDIMNLLLSEEVSMTFDLIKFFWIDANEEEVKQDIIQFFRNENEKSFLETESPDFYGQLDPNFLIELLKKRGYELSNVKHNVFTKISSAFFSTLKEYAFSKFIVTISSKKSKIVPKGRLSMNQNKVTKYIFPQAKEIVKIGSLQLNGIMGYEKYFSGMRFLAFAWLKKAILNQFDPSSWNPSKNSCHLNDFHFVEYEAAKNTNNDSSGDKYTGNIQNESSNTQSSTELNANAEPNNHSKSNINAQLQLSEQNSSKSSTNELQSDNSQSNSNVLLNKSENNQTITNTKNKNVNFNHEVIVTPQSNVSFNIPNLALGKTIISQKKRLLDEKNAILWDMVDNQHNRMVTICALIARSYKLAIIIENYSNEFKFWMPQSIIDHIKQLTTEFGIKEFK